LLARIVQTIERHRMFSLGQRVGVAVSGGADSVCLLYVLRELAPRLNLNLSVLHLDHGLRGEESRGDAQFVRELARRIDLPVAIRSLDLSRAPGNLEQAARQARLEFFRERLASGEIDRVAVGHTRSDQAETVLFRFLRGAGTAGLSAIRPVTAEGLVRPLIEIGRAEVERYLRERGIPWREDSTNSDRHFARNRIRHDLLPQLESEWNPRLAESLAHAADLALADEAYWDEKIARLAERHFVSGKAPDPDAVVILARDLAVLAPAAGRRLVRGAIAQSKGDLRGVSFDHVEAVLEMAASPNGHGRMDLPGLQVIRSFDWLRFAVPHEPRAGFAVPAPVPGRLSVPGSGNPIDLELIENSETSTPCECVYNREMGCVDWASISGPLTLRSWQAGDCYQPAGRASEEKIKNLFQEKRIPVWERSAWPILADRAGIVWSRKFGPAANRSASPSSRTVLQIREGGPFSPAADRKSESAERGIASIK
jgi:tRNA(Ile)-lysidine synthase